MKQCTSRLSAVALFAALTTIVSCEKERTPENSDPNTTEITTHSDDITRVSVETDAVANDASIALESTAGFSGVSLNVAPAICDAAVQIDTTGSTKKITVTYNGVTCYGAHTRTGSVEFAMARGVYWKNAGAVLSITFQNLKITRTSDQKSITINGTHNITNVSGGLMEQFPTLQTITHTASSSNMSVTFDDNTQRTWQLAKKRVFTYNNGVVITTTGNHTQGTKQGIAVWGSNRFGHAFTTTTTQPLIVQQACNFRLTNGVVRHEGWATATATFGLDASGNPAACPGSGSYYCKVDWTGAAGKMHSRLFSY